MPAVRKPRKNPLVLVAGAVLALACAGAIIVAGSSGTPAAEEARNAATDPAVALEVTWRPDVPVQGTVFVVEVAAAAAGTTSAASPALELSGELAGEPLHFERTSAARFRAVAAIPIGTEGDIALRVAAVRASRPAGDSVVAIPVAAGEYRHERLRVAPEFGRRPDSALAARIAAESARARAVSRAAHATPRLWDEPFVRPRDSRITSGFGHGREFNGEVHGRHMGVDFAGAVGAPVVATNRGVVALVADFYLAGTAVYLDHGAGLVTGYFHLSRADVAEAQMVEGGQVIGAVGASGRVTGPHLHWIARYGTVTVNPLGLLDLHERFAPPASEAGAAADAKPGGS